jgi:hypothetical protein
VFRGWNGYNVLTCTVMTRKELLDTILTDLNIYGNEKYIGGTDIPMFIELSLLSSTHYMDDAMSTYTVREESACNTKSLPRKAKFVKAVFDCYLYLASKHNQKYEIDYLTDKCMKTALSAAFWGKNAPQARLIKEKIPHTIRSRLLYLAITNNFLHPAIRLLMIIKSRYLKWKHFQFVKKHSKPIETNNLSSNQSVNAGIKTNR